MVKLFVSYAHADIAFKEQLEKHLSVLIKNGDLSPWTDQVLTPGESWNQSISDALNDAQLIILLISADFLSSEYCYEIEMRDALKRHNDKKAIVVPIILRRCDWQETPFSHLQALPTLGKPIREWPDADEAYMNIVEGLKKSIAMLKRQAIGPTDGTRQPEPSAGNSENNAQPTTRKAPVAARRRTMKYVLPGVAIFAMAVAVCFFIGNSHNKSEVTGSSAKDSVAGPPPAMQPALTGTDMSPATGTDAGSTEKAAPEESSANENGSVKHPILRGIAKNIAGRYKDNHSADNGTGQVNGHNVKRVTYTGGHTFVNTAGIRWVEHAADGQRFFIETARDDWSVYLKSPLQGVTMQLDLSKKQVFIDWNGPNRSALYTITEADAN